MSKIVYLTDEQVGTLETIAERISFFGHKSDALLLKSMVEESE